MGESKKPDAGSHLAGAALLVFALGFGWWLFGPKETKTAVASSPPPLPVVTETPPPRAAPKPAPDLGTLVASMKAKVPDLQAEIDNGAKQNRTSTMCSQGLSGRLARINTRANVVVGSPSDWGSWDDPQLSLAEAFDEVTVETRSCTNCSLEDAPSCAKATAALRKLTSRLANPKAPKP